MDDSKPQLKLDTLAYDDSDNPWKEILELLLPAFMEFFFSSAHAEIDWSRGYTFLDTELRKILHDAEQINRRVDKLAQVYLKSGEQKWILLQVEIQGYRDASFPVRMFVSWYRVFDMYKRNVGSFAILSDDDPSWQPTGFTKEFLGTRVSHEYSFAKLLKYRADRAKLEADPNPMAVVVLAQLEMLETKNDPGKRLQSKIRLVRRLYERGFSREEVINLFKFIDWLLTLPTQEKLVFNTAWSEIEEEKRVPYITSVERDAQERGMVTGIETGIATGIATGAESEARRVLIEITELRFKAIPETLRSKLEEITHIDTLRFLRKKAFEAESLSLFEAELKH